MLCAEPEISAAHACLLLMLECPWMCLQRRQAQLELPAPQQGSAAGTPVITAAHSVIAAALPDLWLHAGRGIAHTDPLLCPNGTAQLLWEAHLFGRCYRYRL